MTRFNAKIGAGALIGLGALYMVLSLVSGHSARAEPPPDLRADAAGIDVWKALALMIDEGDGLAIIDVRAAELFQLHHVPGSRSLPGAGAAALRAAVGDHEAALIVAGKDAEASRLVGQLQAEGASRLHCLSGGVQSWYLSVVLPVQLFSDEPAPRGYTEAISLLHAWLDGAGEMDRGEVREAVGRLASSAFLPSQLGTKKKAASSGQRKKIRGGCG